MSAEEYYDHTTYPVANSLGTSQGLRNELELIEGGFGKLPDLAGNANKPVFVRPDGSGLTAASTFPDTTDGNASTAAHGFLPKLPGSVALYLRGDGSWAGVGNTGLTRSPRTANTPITVNDTGTFIDITAGTFTQTFGPVAEIGPGWYIFIRNGGTGDITLDPSGAELIDGLTSYIMYPGEARMIFSDGTAFYSFVLAPFTKEFAASANFIKPPGYTTFEVELWGAGCGGQGGGTTNGGEGGGGGGYFAKKFASAQLAASTPIVLGAGGNGGTGTNTASGNAGVAGGNSSFGGTLLTANGAPSRTGGTGAGISSSPYFGGAGGTQSTSAGNAGTNTALAGAGGGSGAGNSGNTYLAGDGGVRMGGTAAIGTYNTAGAAGQPFCGGAGGAMLGTNGLAGGNGGTAAGGGGGGRNNGGTLASGGKGGDGYCIVRGA